MNDGEKGKKKRLGRSENLLCKYFMHRPAIDDALEDPQGRRGEGYGQGDIDATLVQGGITNCISVSPAFLPIVPFFPL